MTTGALRVLIADDEAIARRGLERLLRAEPEIDVVAACGSGDEALEAIQAERPDVAFLDIAMPGLTGVEVARALDPAKRPAIVFVTAFDRFAIDAFDLHAVDYLLKPFDAERFRMALYRVRERLAVRGPAMARLEAVLATFAERRPETDRIAVKDGDRVIFLGVDEIDWCEAEDNYVRIHAGARRHLVRITMRALEAQLGNGFARIHRSYIVNVSRLRELRPLPSGEYQAVLANGLKLVVSRGYRDAVMGKVGANR
jgi:two-component system LytT family response regulator